MTKRLTTGLTLTLGLVMFGLLSTVQPGAAGVDVRVDFDKQFDFRKAHTWGWNPQGAGAVRMARTPDDDPEAVRVRAEPVIKKTVAAELARRKLRPTDGTPDLTVTYYLLLTVGSSAQTLGQFLPPVAEWGLPPFAPQTTSFTVVEQGSLVLDLSANDEVVWRGIAQAKLKFDDDDVRRTALLREGVRDLLRRFPPRQ